MPRLSAALLPMLLLGLFGCAATQPRPSASDTEASVAPARSESAAALVRDSAKTLREMRAASPRQELDHWLRNARGVVVIPGVYRAGFIYSLHGGQGVVLARRADGSWSPPAFVSMGGAGFGVQAGLERERVVLVLLEQEALDQVLAGGLDFGATAMFDAVGVREQTGPDSRTRGKPVLAFTDGFGLMAGVGMKGGGLGQFRSLNTAYHGQGAAEGADVLRGQSIPGVEVLELWEALRVDLPDETDGHILRGTRP